MPLDLLLDYQVKHVTFGLKVKLKFLVRILCSGVPGFATDLLAVFGALD